MDLIRNSICIQDKNKPLKTDEFPFHPPIQSSLHGDKLLKGSVFPFTFTKQNQDTCFGICSSCEVTFCHITPSHLEQGRDDVNTYFHTWWEKCQHTKFLFRNS